MCAVIFRQSPSVCAEIGDYINQDDIVVVIETDKVAVEVRSPTAGTLTAQLAEEGERRALALMRAVGWGSCRCPSPAPAL